MYRMNAHDNQGPKSLADKVIGIEFTRRHKELVTGDLTGINLEYYHIWRTSYGTMKRHVGTIAMSS